MNDLTSRKRFLSVNMENAPAAKIAPPTEQLSGFTDIMIVQLLRALNVTEPTQRTPLLDDILFRVQWLKEQQASLDVKNKTKQEKVQNPRDAQPFDPEEMLAKIKTQVDTLQSMAKIFRLTNPAGQNGNHVPLAAPVPSATSPFPPSHMLVPHINVPTAPVLTQPPQAPIPKWAQSMTKTPPPQTAKKIETASSNQKQMIQNAEEFMLDLQKKQRKLLSSIEVAHGGVVTNEILHEYLKYPFVRLRENGVVRQHPNPFYHLMNPQATPSATSSPPSTSAGPPVITIKDSLKLNTPPQSLTPIPAPPVLQVELPIRKEESPKKEVTKSPTEKVTPPPQLPPQLPSNVPFKMPVTRQCNQWSVFSMALPLRLMCRCNQIPCKCHF